MYSYDNKYMLSATLRSDGSSRLAKGHQWHTYPAISAGWNIGNENFMKDVSWVDALKIRLGYGQTSNQSVAPYATLGRLSTRPYNFGDEYSTGYYVSELPNNALGWEYSETFNYGLDFGLFANRLSGTIEYYTTKTKDLLLGVGLPATSGVGSYTANVGQTQNKGLELSLNGVIIDNREGWTWEVGANLYANRNKLVALASGAMRDEGNWWFVGHPIDVIYDYEKIGLWQEGEPHLTAFEPGGNPGMIKVKYTGEYNPDGSPVRAIGADDRQIMSIEPKFQGGFNTRVAYKGFDLSTVAAFKSGGTLISTLYSSSGYLNMMSGRRNNVQVDFWTPENTDAQYPKPGGIMSGDNPKYGSTLGYFDASYLKIRTISLGYNFDKNPWLSDMGLNNLRLYFTAQNPFVLFSPYKKESGMDPETNSYGNENAAVAYSQNLRRLLTIGTNAPATRSYLVGINLTF
jgi:TonB-linked SusC/RagA family outer membrane protein